MLAVVKPSPLRLWGFILTVLGGALMAFGSIGDWAAISLGGGTQDAVPTKGVDIWQGRVTLLLGALIVVGILGLRFVRPGRRQLLAGSLTLLALVGVGVAAWCVLARDSLFRDTGIDRLVDLVVTQLGISMTRAREQVVAASAAAGIDVRAKISLWVTLAGSVVAFGGGLVDLAWVRQKRMAGDAIDPDTLPTTSDPDA